ncbi:MAG TPA: hypothetical protein VJB87_02350 [Candidatus Nanoarchaeia archaeon]|nr:hypothetical protein [Candidatus Nanoarchaeia archaeon]
MKIVEFMGMPKAGKSTHIELAETILKHQRGARVRVVYEGARVCPLDKGEDRFLYHTWSFHNTMNHLAEARMGHFDFIFVDRGVFDHIAFTRALGYAGVFSQEQCDAQVAYFSQFSFLQDVVIACMVDPDVALAREQKHHEQLGRVMNAGFLPLLSRAYREVIDTLSLPYHYVDGNRTLADNNKYLLALL